MCRISGLSSIASSTASNGAKGRETRKFEKPKQKASYQSGTTAQQLLAASFREMQMATWMVFTPTERRNWPS